MKKILTLVSALVMVITMFAAGLGTESASAQSNMGWKNINGLYSYLDVNGNRVYGWQRINGLLYYFNKSGYMVKGVQTIGGKVYEFNNDGTFRKQLNQQEVEKYEASVKTSKSLPKGKTYVYDKKGNVIGTGKKYVSNASAYTGDTTTASGQRPRWGTIAVDPKVIPLGSKVYVPYFDKVFIANDTGGIIKGTMIDIFMKSAYNMNQFGRRNIDIYVLDK